MKPKLSCKNCIHFVQHYMRVDNDYYKVPCGHCDNGRVPKEYSRIFISAGYACTLFESLDDEIKDN